MDNRNSISIGSLVIGLLVVLLIPIVSLGMIEDFDLLAVFGILLLTVFWGAMVLRVWLRTYIGQNHDEDSNDNQTKSSKARRNKRNKH